MGYQDGKNRMDFEEQMGNQCIRQILNNPYNHTHPRKYSSIDFLLSKNHSNLHRCMLSLLVLDIPSNQSNLSSRYNHTNHLKCSNQIGSNHNLCNHLLLVDYKCRLYQFQYKSQEQVPCL